jgi:tight adherence protein B
MTSRLAMTRRGGRLRLVVVALVVVSLIGVAGTLAATLAAASARGRGATENHERFDLVGEGHPSGPLRVSLGHAVFPTRALLLSVPAGRDVTPERVRVIEDGRTVPGVVVTRLGGAASSAQSRLSYVSKVRAGEREVEVSVIVTGIGTFDLDYSAPRSVSPAVSHHLRVAGAGHGKAGRSSTGSSNLATNANHDASSFWTSKLGLADVAGIAALLVAAAVALLLVSRRRRPELKQRIGEFTMSDPGMVDLPSAADEEASLPALERLLARRRWWPSFQEEVEIARYGRSAVELVALDAVATVIFTAVVAVALSPVLAALILGAGPFALRSAVRRRVRKQRGLFADQLSQQLEELASAMRAGHSLVPALAATVESAPEPSRTEWERVVADERLGMPLDDAMRSLARRMASPDVEQVALVAALHQRTGGNMAEILDRVAEGVRERAELRRELNALTAQARLSRVVITALPPGLLVVIELINPNYMRPLFTTTGGNIMLAVAVVLLTSAWLAMRAITEVKV